MQHGLLHVQNLAAQGQNSLKTAIATLLGGTARRVTLYQKDLALCGVGL